MTTSPGRLLGATALAVLALAVLPGTAAAHTPFAADSCDGLTITMNGYPSPGTPNHLVVTVDGTVVIDAAFGENFHQFVPWSPAATHQWSVVVDGLTDDGDATLSGTQAACEAGDGGATTTTSAAVTTTTDVASEGPTPPDSTSSAGGPLLPATGGETSTAWLALVLAASGAVMAAAAVRRRVDS